MRRRRYFTRTVIPATKPQRVAAFFMACAFYAAVLGILLWTATHVCEAEAYQFHFELAAYPATNAKVGTFQCIDSAGRATTNCSASDDTWECRLTGKKCRAYVRAKPPKKTSIQWLTARVL